MSLYKNRKTAIFLQDMQFFTLVKDYLHYIRYLLGVDDIKFELFRCLNNNSDITPTREFSKEKMPYHRPCHFAFWKVLCVEYIRASILVDDIWQNLYLRSIFLGVLTHARKSPITFVVAVRLSASISTSLTGRISVEIEIGDFNKDLFEKSHFFFKWNKKSGTLDELITFNFFFCQRLEIDIESFFFLTEIYQAVSSSVRQSICPHIQRGSHWTDLCEV
jgi:hypothetical protein